MVKSSNATQMKRRIKKIRQRLMALKHEFVEPAIGENTGIAHRAALGAAKGKLSRWLQDLQRLRQARKEGAASIGLIVGDMTKVLIIDYILYHTMIAKMVTNSPFCLFLNSS
jgi:hypothetical protein